MPLQLFLLPVDTRPEDFDAESLREVAAGLMRRVYRRDEGDPLFRQTFSSFRRPALQPVTVLRDLSTAHRR